MLLCRHEFVVEKVTKDGSEMVGKSARRDVVFYYFSKLLERTLSRFTLGYRMVTCTTLASGALKLVLRIVTKASIAAPDQLRVISK